MNDAELVARYEANYGLSGVTPDQPRRHLALERALTQKLLESTPEDRWEVFETCYDELYAGLPWLAGTGGQTDADRWGRLVGREPAEVYEVGSGAGALARELRRLGHAVEATDVSRHRGDRTDEAGVRWTSTDGVHLDRFAQGAPYDLIVSDQLIEHLHPDDVADHFAGARAILRPEVGRYILRTPSSVNGPHDVSRVFKLEQPIGMHLREYTVGELAGLLRSAGFRTVQVVVPLPRGHGMAAPSWFTRVYAAAERRLLRLDPGRRSAVLRVLRGPLYPNVWLVATRD